MSPARSLLLVGATATVFALLTACSNSSAPASGNHAQLEDVDSSDGGTCSIPAVTIRHGAQTAGASRWVSTDEIAHGVVKDDSRWTGSTVGALSLSAMVEPAF